MDKKPKATIANFHGKISIETWLADMKQYLTDLMLDKEHLSQCPACKAGIFCNHIAIAARLLGIPEKEAIKLVVEAQKEALNEFLCANLIIENPESKTEAEQNRRCAKNHAVFRESGFSHEKYFFECRCELLGCHGDYKPRGAKKQNP